MDKKELAERLEAALPADPAIADRGAVIAGDLLAAVIAELRK